MLDGGGLDGWQYAVDHLTEILGRLRVPQDDGPGGGGDSSGQGVGRDYDAAPVFVALLDGVAEIEVLGPGAALVGHLLGPGVESELDGRLVVGVHIDGSAEGDPDVNRCADPVERAPGSGRRVGYPDLGRRGAPVGQQAGGDLVGFVGYPVQVRRVPLAG